MSINPNPIYILLADDDQEDRDLFQESLNELSISVSLVTLEDGARLSNHLSLLSECPPPHLIFIDINMPYKSGFECLKEIRSNKLFEHIPVFIYSTSMYQGDVDTAFEMGANRYIPKPLSISELIQMLKGLFSVHWENYLLRVPRKDFIMTFDKR